MRVQLDASQVDDPSESRRIIDDDLFRCEVLKILKARPFALNVPRMMANAQGIFPDRSKLSDALFTKINIDPRLREIAILRTAKDCRSIYEWTQHVPAAKHVGVTDEQIAAIEKWSEADCFNELERLVLRLTDEVNSDVKDSRETVKALNRYLSPGQIV